MVIVATSVNCLLLQSVVVVSHASRVNASDGLRHLHSFSLSIFFHRSLVFLDVECRVRINVDSKYTGIGVLHTRVYFYIIKLNILSIDHVIH